MYSLTRGLLLETLSPHLAAAVIITQYLLSTVVFSDAKERQTKSVLRRFLQRYAGVYTRAECLAFNMLNLNV